MKIEDDPILSELIDTPEKKARWIKRLRWLYILWLIFVILGLTFLFFTYLS